MPDRDHLAADEAGRIRQHESVKDDVRQQVHSDIAGQARATAVDPAREAATAASLKRQAVDEIADAEQELARGRTAARGSQLLDYGFYLIYGIIGLAIALEAIGARESAGFTQFVNALASPFVAPFHGIVRDPTAGGARFMLSYVVALGVYILLHMAVNGALRLMTRRKTAV
jgi:uncharacterized protein YggT (Ycf19 family)